MVDVGGGGGVRLDEPRVGFNTLNYVFVFVRVTKLQLIENELTARHLIYFSAFHNLTRSHMTTHYS